jgi:hypothetical protein
LPVTPRTASEASRKFAGYARDPPRRPDGVGGHLNCRWSTRSIAITISLGRKNGTVKLVIGSTELVIGPTELVIGSTELVIGSTELVIGPTELVFERPTRLCT